MLSISITGGERTAGRFRHMPDSVRRALHAKIAKLALQLEAHVKSDKLSGQTLHTRSGRLKRSIKSEIVDRGSIITAKVFSTGVPYAAIHEFGGRTQAHEIVATKARALSFIMGGKRVFFKRVHHPGSVMPQRSYLRSAMDDMHQQIVDEMAAAVREAVRS